MLALAAWQQGCASQPGLQRSSLAKLRTDFGSSRTCPAPAVFEDLLARRFDSLRTFRGQARLDYEGPDGSYRASQMITVRAPDSARIEFMSPFGPTYTVVTDDGRLYAWDRGEKTLYRGRASVENLGRFTRAPLSAEVLLALIRGLPAHTGKSKDGGRVLEDERRCAWERGIEGGRHSVIVFSKERLEPLSLAVFERSGEPELGATFGSYEDVDGTRLPHLVTLELKGGIKIRLSYSRLWRDIGAQGGL
ncbi:MAG: hypothetical protein ACE5D3_06580, partial [Candidatus Binatia bacterium]